MDQSHTVTEETAKCEQQPSDPQGTTPLLHLTVPMHTREQVLHPGSGRFMTRLRIEMATLSADPEFGSRSPLWDVNPDTVI